MRLIDLSAHFNAALDDDWLVSAGANLKRLPKGIQTFNGIRFDIRGLIQLGGLSLYEESDYNTEDKNKHYPDRVDGIKIGQKTPAINFLHATAWGGEKGLEVGEYVIRYTDGSLITVPLNYLDVFRDWWFMPEDEMPGNAKIAWTGLNDLTKELGYQVRLFNYKWENPQSDKRIHSIDFISKMTEVSPFLVAITLDE
jgi:hypothetical protein